MNIRMYNVGFGDCFLVTIPTQDGPRRVLFDCGSISQGPNSMDQVLEQLWRDCGGADGTPAIDVVVATHRHKDHVSGFAKGGWDRVVVREVWMPWTEDPADPEAKRIRDVQAKLAAALDGAVKARLQAAPGDPRLETWLELVSNALSNEAAMTTLHEGFSGHPTRRFLPDKRHPELTFITDVLPGVTVFVLGPSRDEEVIRDMDPPAGKSYLRLLGSKADTGEGAPNPFDPGWRLDAPPVEGPALSLDDQEAMAKVGDVEPAVAVALDKAVNGTSLMLVFKVGTTHVLFPGDAQWGTWQAAMRNPTATELLRKTRFYKVGHHGSHNATPTEFVEDLMTGDGMLSMVSTRPVANWPHIPKPELLAALEARHVKLARSDESQNADASVFHAVGQLYVDVEVPSEGS